MTLADVGRDLDTLKAAGASMVRTAFPWPLLQPRNSAQFDPTAVARINDFLAMAKDRGIQVLAIFGSTPCWASSAPADVRRGCTLSTGAWARYPTSSAAALRTAATEFAARWGDELAGVEFWNEPNNRRFFAGSYAAYVTLLKIFYPAVKAVAPNLPVAAGVLSLSDTSFLKGMYAAGAKGYFDAISVHPYEIRLGPAAATSNPAVAWPQAPKRSSFTTGVQALHQVMVDEGDANLPIWITEFGFSDCTVGSKLCVSATQQARYLSETFRMAARWPYVRIVLSYLTRDTASDGSWTGSFGMVRSDGTPKPALQAVTNTWHCLGARTC